MTWIEFDMHLVVDLEIGTFEATYIIVSNFPMLIDQRSHNSST